jgi:hypothetical protein
MGDGRCGGEFMTGGCILYYIRFIAWLLGLQNQPQDTDSIREDENILLRVLDIRFAILDSED